jgi:hypothetical protein
MCRLTRRYINKEGVYKKMAKKELKISSGICLVSNSSYSGLSLNGKELKVIIEENLPSMGEYEKYVGELRLELSLIIPEREELQVERNYQNEVPVKDEVEENINE